MPYLLLEGGDDKGICPDFLTEIVSRIDEDDTVKPMLTKAVVRLSQDLSKMSMNDNYKTHINVGSEIAPTYAHSNYFARRSRLCANFPRSWTQLLRIHCFKWPLQHLQSRSSQYLGLSSGSLLFKPRLPRNTLQDRKLWTRDA